MFGGAVRFEEIGRNHRRDHPRNGQADQDRDHHSQPEIAEKLPGNAGHQADRQEHCDDRKGRSDYRQANLVSRVDRGLISAFAHPHVSDDVLNLNDRIIDQHACNQAQREQ